MGSGSLVVIKGLLGKGSNSSRIARMGTDFFWGGDLGDFFGVGNSLYGCLFGIV